MLDVVGHAGAQPAEAVARSGLESGICAMWLEARRKSRGNGALANTCPMSQPRIFCRCMSQWEPLAPLQHPVFAVRVFR